MNTRLSLTPSVKNPFGLSAKLVGHSAGCTIHWGDGSAPNHAVPGKSYEHSFPAVGRYMVTCVDTGGVLVARQQISVTGNLGLPEVYVSGDNQAIRVSFSDPDPRLGAASYRVEWQDGEVEHVWGVPGHTLRHPAQTGSHKIRLVDTFSGRTQEFDVRVSNGPVYEPDFTVQRWPEDASGMTVYVKLKKVQPGKPIHIWWDDADGPQLVQNPLVGMEIPHVYSFPGHYMQTVAYAGETLPSVATKSESITVPAVEGERVQKQITASEFQDSLHALARAYRVSRRDSGGHRGLRGLRGGGEDALALEAGQGGGAAGVGQPATGYLGGGPVFADAGAADEGVEAVIVDGESEGPSGSRPGGL